MSAARKAADPFNFDDLYKQAGVDDLFVKKTMAESRQQPAASTASGTKTTASAPPSKGTDPFGSLGTPSKGTAASKQQPAAQPMSGLDFDFLGTAAKSPQPAVQFRTAPAAYSATAYHPANSSTNTNGHSAMDFDFFGSSTSTTSSTVAVPAASKPAVASSSADPFAAFEAIDGAMPAVVAQAPASASASNLLGFDLGDEFLTPLEPAPPSPVQLSADPTFVVPAQPPVQTFQLHDPAATSSPTTSHPSRDASPAYTRPLQPAVQPTRVSQQADARAAQVSPDPYRSQQAGSSDGEGSSYSRRQHSSSGAIQHSQQSQQEHSYDSHDSSPAAAYEKPRASGGSNSGAATITPGSRFQYREAGDRPPQHTGPAGMAAAAGKGLTGYLKTLGKQAVKAAQAGLQAIETTLEKMEQPASAHSSSSTPDVSSDEALAIAFRLADLPPHQQEETLAELPRSMRLKVLQLLKEQAHLELQGGGSGGAAADSHTRGQRRTQDSSDGAHERWHGVGSNSPTLSSGPGSPYGDRPVTSEYGRHQAPQATSFGRHSQQHSSQEDLASSSTHTRVREDATPVARASAAAPQPAMFEPSFPAPGLQEQYSTSAAAAAAPPPPPPQHDMWGVHDDSPAHAAVSAAPAPHADLLGFDGGPVAAPAALPQQHSQHQVHSVEDVDDFFTGGSSSSSVAPARAAATVSAASRPVAASPAVETHIDDFFAGGSSGGSSSLGGPTAAAAAAPRRQAAKAADMSAFAGMDLDGLDGGGATHAALYDDDVEQEGEPEIRKILRAQRRAEQHAKMKAVLAEKIAFDAEEARKREEQVSLKEGYKAQVNTWKNKHKGNIRGLLGSLQTVLWDGSGWVPVGMGDLLEANQVKRVYMKANLLVHPDKVRQRNGTAEQVAIADMIFDVLKESWEIFR